MILNEQDQTITLKICYYGPAMSGKTTSIKALFNHFGKENEVFSIENTTGRTLFFDYGTITFQNDTYKIKTEIYSTTGQDFYIITRPITLNGTDGVIFIADSQTNTYQRNLISWYELAGYFGDKMAKLPLVIAFNKQDLPNRYNPTVFLKEIEAENCELLKIHNTIAINGENILLCFEDMLGLLLKNLYMLVVP